MKCIFSQVLSLLRLHTLPLFYIFRMGLFLHESIRTRVNFEWVWNRGMEVRSYTPATTGCVCVCVCVCVCDTLLYCRMLGDKVFMSHGPETWLNKCVLHDWMNARKAAIIVHRLRVWRCAGYLVLVISFKPHNFRQCDLLRRGGGAEVARPRSQN